MQAAEGRLSPHGYLSELRHDWLSARFPENLARLFTIGDSSVAIRESL